MSGFFSGAALTTEREAYCACRSLPGPGPVQHVGGREGKVGGTGWGGVCLYVLTLMQVRRTLRKHLWGGI